jgi:hypothetical protein
MYQNEHFLDHFFALLDFGSRDEERRTKSEGRRVRGEERRTKGERRGGMKDRSGENKWFWGFFIALV